MISSYSTSSNSLRIGMLVGSYVPDPEGGAERQCRRIVQTLMARGFTVEVITFRHSRQPQQPSYDGGVSILRLGFLGPTASRFRRALESHLIKIISSNDPSSTGVKERRMRAVAFWIVMPAVWLARLEFIFELRQFAMRNSKSFDVLHVHESGWLAGIGVALGKRWHIPVICKESTAPALGPIGYDTPFRRTWDKQRKFANAWLAQTSAIRDELLSLGITPGRVHLLINGVVLPSEMASPENSKIVLYVGNLTQGSSWKAFDVLFDAWIRIAKARNDVRLIVAGGGDPATWIRILQEHGVRESVDFLGHVADPSPFYRKAGIFVLPSRVEGMSNALLEAMSWGLPSVVSDIPGNRAVVDHEVNSLVVPVNNSAALADAITRLLNDPTLRSSLGTQSRKKVESEFDIQSVTDRLIGIYNSLLS